MKAPNRRSQSDRLSCSHQLRFEELRSDYCVLQRASRATSLDAGKLTFNLRCLTPHYSITSRILLQLLRSTTLSAASIFSYKTSLYSSASRQYHNSCFLFSAMKAIKIIKSEKGQEAEIQDVPLPKLRDDYLICKVLCVGINPTDWCASHLHAIVSKASTR